MRPGKNGLSAYISFGAADEIDPRLTPPGRETRRRPAMGGSPSSDVPAAGDAPRLGTLAMMSVRPWPALRDEDRWLIAAMEERLHRDGQEPSELRARAGELRAQAERSDIQGVRDAALAIAERYENAAAARLAAG